VAPFLLVLAVLGAIVSCPGCSLVFVKRPLPAERGLPERPGPCTSSKVLPTVDVVIAGLQLAGTAVAASASEADYDGSPISREGDIALGVALAAVFATSAIYGFATTSRCTKLEEQQSDEWEWMKRDPTTVACNRGMQRASRAFVPGRELDFR
jgi:hypothetical protein